MPKSVYRRRNPQNSPYYQCVEDHFEIFEMVYEDRFERQYGFFCPSFHQKRMIYHRETGQVEYRSKDGSQAKVFDAIEWLAAMCPIKANRWSDTMAIIVTR